MHVTGRFNDAHTGDRRCWPCTALNAVGLAVVVAVVGIRWPFVALAVALGGAAAITFNGYLFPFTPAWAPRLAAMVPGETFDHGGGAPPSSSGSLGADDESGERVLETLLAGGVLVDDGELRLAADFRRDWREAMDTVRDEDVARAAVAVTPGIADAYWVETDGTEWLVVEGEGGGIENETWLSRPVAIADVATLVTLADRDVDPEIRTAAVTPLRMFLETCPHCGRPVERTTSSCCCGGGTDPERGPEDDILACTHCDARLYTF